MELHHGVSSSYAGKPPCWSFRVLKAPSPAQDLQQEGVKKKRRASSKPYTRSIVGASLEVLQKKRSEKAEVRAAAREAALR